MQVELQQNQADQEDELSALSSIFPEEFSRGGDPEHSGSGFDHHLPVNFNTSAVHVRLLIEKKTPDQLDEEGGEDGGSSDECASMSSTTVGAAGRVLFHLPPILLSWSYPPSYPSRSLPDFKVTCPWMMQGQLQLIHEALKTCNQEAAGLPTIFSWHSFLSESVMDILGFQDAITIRTHHGAEKTNDDVLCGAMFSELIAFDTSMREKTYKQSWHLCALCFDEKQGSSFHKLSCTHAFCTPCLASMSAVHVKEGTLSSLSCPLPDCGQPFTSSSLRALLSQDLFSRYTALSASRAVQAIEGLRFCPRCDPSALPDPRAVTLCPIKECDQEPSCPYAHSVGQVLEPVPCLPDGGLYVCSQCEFAFCGECMRSYHPGVSCEEASGGAGQEEALMQRIEELRKEENRSQVLLRQLQQQQAAILSERHIQQSAKSCPHCKMKIEKSGGCNHMTCASCRTHFCWLCLKVMPATSPYDHFATCKLSNGHIQAPDPTDQQARARIETTGRFAAQRQVAQAIPSIVCPNCRSRVFKDTHNNHLPCPSCSTPLCFQCRTAVRRPASHFSPRHPQHSDPRLDLERQHHGPGRRNLKPGSKPAPAAAAAPSPGEPIRGALRQAGPAAPAAGAEGGQGAVTTPGRAAEGGHHAEEKEEVQEEKQKNEEEEEEEKEEAGKERHEEDSDSQDGTDLNFKLFDSDDESDW